MSFSPIGSPLRKGNGRIVVDPSAHIHNADNTGALHNQTERTYPERVPRTYYTFDQRRHLMYIWSLCIYHPTTEILLYKYGINSAFYQGRYQPDIGA